jgi:RHS repeat-associated protein
MCCFSSVKAQLTNLNALKGIPIGTLPVLPSQLNIATQSNVLSFTDANDALRFANIANTVITRGTSSSGTLIDQDGKIGNLVVNPSPNSMNLISQIQANANLYTGKLSVGLPITNLQGIHLEVPVSINHSGSGVKTNDIGSWVGLGFDLSAGGSITRIMKNMPDEFNGDVSIACNGGKTLVPFYGYLKTKNTPINNKDNIAVITGGIDFNLFSTYSEEKKKRIVAYSNWLGLNACNGEFSGTKPVALDSEPDEFFFNFGGYSGKFVFNQDGDINTIPFYNFEITKTIQVIDSKEKIAKFQVKTPEGNTYVFGSDDMLTGVEESQLETTSLTNLYSYIWRGDVKNTAGQLLARAYFLDPQLDVVGQNSQNQPVYNDFNRNTEVKTYFYFPSTWHLTEIIASTKEKMLFTYNDAGEIRYTQDKNFNTQLPNMFQSVLSDGALYYVDVPESIQRPDGTINKDGLNRSVHLQKQTLSYSVSEIKLKGKRLASISTENGKVLEFTATTDRVDVVGDKRLDRITYKIDGQTIKSWDLGYAVKKISKNTDIDDFSKQDVYELYQKRPTSLSAFPAPMHEFASYAILKATILKQANPSFDDVAEVNKLKQMFRAELDRCLLKSITEKSGDNTLSQINYVLNYYNETENIDRRFSTHQDYWGYCNFNNNGTLMPKISYYQKNVANQFVSFPASNTLSLINWATLNDARDSYLATANGHHTVANLARSRIFALQDIQFLTGGKKSFEYELNDWGLLKGAGLRISKIINYTDGISFGNGEQYLYEGGEITNTPTKYYQDLNYDFFNQKVTFSSSFVNPTISTKGSLVGYRKVTVKQIDNNGLYPNGYTEYTFTTPKQVANAYKIVKIVNGSSDINYDASKFYPVAASPFGYPYPMMVDFDWKRGQIENVAIYDKDNNKINETTNEWASTETFITGKKSVGLSSARYSLFSAIKPFESNFLEYRYSVYEYSTGIPTLIKTTEKAYFLGNNTPIETVTDYTHRPWRNPNSIKTQTTTNSDGAKYKTTYTYSSEMVRSPTTNPDPITLLQLNNIDVVMETEVSRKVGTNPEVIIDGNFVGYGVFTVRGIGVPLPSSWSKKPKGNYVLVSSTNSYDSRHGLIKNLTYNNYLISNNFEWDINGNPTAKTFGGLSMEYTYNPTNRLLEMQKNENGLKTKYEYDALSRLSIVKDRFDGTSASPQNPQTTTTYNYHYKGQATALAEDVNRNFMGTSTAFLNTTGALPLSTKQYSDGLGRPFLTYKHQYALNSQHQKSYVTYDILGRTDKMYQPFANATQGVDASIPSGSDFKQTIYEASPLSRPIRQIAEDGKYMEIAYSTNLGSGTEGVRKFAITYSNNVRTIATDGYYDANTLSKTTIWDENAQIAYPEKGRTDTHTDKLGRVILIRKYVTTPEGIYKKVETYNVYDDFGDLVMVVPPGAINLSTNTIASALVFEYTFDNERRLSKKKVPNANEVCYFYNNRGLLALMQDGNMLLAGKYLATVYDDLGRVVKTGFVTSNDPNNIVISDVVNDENRMTRTLYYPNSSWVQHQEAKVLSHDEITPIRKHIWSYIERRSGYTYTGNPIWTGKQHLLSKTYRSGWSLINADEPINDDDYGGVDWSVSGYDGLQKPTLSIRYLFSGQSGSWQHSQEVRQSQTFMYDNGQRLGKTNYMYALQGAGITATPMFELSNMSYNERDLLTIKKTAFVSANGISGKYLQSTNFAYNNRNWLTSINSGFANSALDYPLFSGANAASSGYYSSLAGGNRMTPASNTGEDNPDLFKEIIRYGNPIEIPTNFATPAQYNGNISQIEYQVAGYEAQAYSFKYDNLDRMTQANYADIHSTGWASRGWADQYESDTKFQENVTYDMRGNIQALTRKGTSALPSGFNNNTGLMYGNFGNIDDLIYTYDPNNANKLTGVKDYTDNLEHGFKTVEGGNNNAAVADYTYDANGNITSDLNKNITNIEYNYLNLPTKITIDDGSNYYYKMIYFVYDASGQKHQKIVRQYEASFESIINNITDTYTYVSGIEYKNGVLQRFAHTEGSVALQADGTTYSHEYVIKDHLGNTRVTYRDDNTAASPYGTIKVEEIVQTNHFYPFGANMEGTWNGSFPEAKNKYQFNGKELNSDFGLEWNDFGTRFYDPSVARWLSVDPLSEKMNRHSPYNYTFNNPVRFIDPNGSKPNDIVYYNYLGVEVNREVSNKDFKAFVGSRPIGGSSYYTEAPMPGVVGGHEAPVYQQYDYIIAAETFIFNQKLGYATALKNPNLVQKHEGGSLYHLEGKFAHTIDVNLVKAMLIQETSGGTDTKLDGLNDIMQVNVKGDWKTSSDLKTAVGLKKGGAMTPQSSLSAFFPYLFLKGFIGGGMRTEETDHQTGKTEYYKSWEGRTDSWYNAILRYNGGGAEGKGATPYGEAVLNKYRSITPATATNY